MPRHPPPNSLQDGDLLWPIANTQLFLTPVDAPRHPDALRSARPGAERWAGEAAALRAQLQARGKDPVAQQALAQLDKGYDAFWASFNAAQAEPTPALAGGWGWLFAGHVGMVVNGGRQVIDATPAHGVALAESGKWLAEYTGYQVIHRRPRGWGAEAARHAQQWINRPYDWTSPLDTTDDFYCTKLCFAALQAVSGGRALTRPDPARWALAPYWLTPTEMRACAGLVAVP